MERILLMVESNTAHHIITALGLDNDALFLRNVEHFSEKEGTNRDQIVEGYFGTDGLEDLYTEIVQALQGTHTDPDIQHFIDLATGTGTFLFPIMERLKINRAVVFDATPKFLEIIDQKAFDKKIQTVIGDLEQIRFSLELNQRNRQLNLPDKYDRVLSTLALHHIPDTQAVLTGIADILTDQGVAVIVDMILDENPGSDWIPDPTHAHHGFRMAELTQQAKILFDKVTIRELPVKCVDSSCDSRGSGIFLLTLESPR